MEEKIKKDPINMKTSKKEIENVSKLSSFKRYEYFIKRVADFEIMYSLVDEHGSFAISEIEEKYMLPFWSAKEYAILNTVKEWQNYQIIEITLEIFENKIIDLIESNNYLLNIFPMNEKTGFVVEINEFVRDLSTEIKKYD